MKHFVVEQVLNGVARTRGTVEDAAHDNGVVGRVVMAEHAPGMMLTPRKLRTAEQPVKKTRVERVEYLFEVVIAPLRAGVALGPASTANLLRAACDGFAVLESFIAMIVRAVDGLLVNLGDEDMCNCAQHALRSAFEQIGKTYVQLTFTQTDGGIEGNESPEADVKGRHGCTRTQCPVLLLKNGNDVLSHQFGD